jgi:hypothetical protein
MEGALLLSHLGFPFPISLNLDGQCIHISDVVLLLHSQVVAGDDVLFLFLPTELLSFEITDVFRFFALLLEPLVSLVIYFLQVLNVLLAFSLGMVIHFEWTLGTHEVGVGLIVVIS